MMRDLVKRYSNRQQLSSDEGENIPDSTRQPISARVGTYAIQLFLLSAVAQHFRLSRWCCRREAWSSTLKPAIFEISTRPTPWLFSHRDLVADGASGSPGNEFPLAG